MISSRDCELGNGAPQTFGTFGTNAAGDPSYPNMCNRTRGPFCISLSARSQPARYSREVCSHVACKREDGPGSRIVCSHTRCDRSLSHSEFGRLPIPKPHGGRNIFARLGRTSRSQPCSLIPSTPRIHSPRHASYPRTVRVRIYALRVICPRWYRRCNHARTFHVEHFLAPAFAGSLLALFWITLALAGLFWLDSRGRAPRARSGSACPVRAITDRPTRQGGAEIVRLRRS